MARRAVIAGLVCTLASCTPAAREAEPRPRAVEGDVPVPDQPTPRAEPLLAKHPRCLLETGCPKVPRLEPCPDALAPTSVAWVLRHHEDVAGKPIAVRGILEARSGGCTLVGCRATDGSDRQLCCNRCDGELVLRDEGEHGGLWLSTDYIFCEGDESATCCSRDVDDVVIVQGRVSSYDLHFHPQSRPGLLDATVCRVES